MLIRLARSEEYGAVIRSAAKIQKTAIHLGITPLFTSQRLPRRMMEIVITVEDYCTQSSLPPIKNRLTQYLQGAFG